MSRSGRSSRSGKIRRIRRSSRSGKIRRSSRSRGSSKSRRKSRPKKLKNNRRSRKKDKKKNRSKKIVVGRRAGMDGIRIPLPGPGPDALRELLDYGRSSSDEEGDGAPQPEDGGGAGPSFDERLDMESKRHYEDQRAQLFHRDDQGRTVDETGKLLVAPEELNFTVTVSYRGDITDRGALHEITYTAGDGSGRASGAQRDSFRVGDLGYIKSGFSGSLIAPGILKATDESEDGSSHTYSHKFPDEGSSAGDLNELKFNVKIKKHKKQTPHATPTNAGTIKSDGGDDDTRGMIEVVRGCIFQKFLPPLQYKRRKR